MCERRVCVGVRVSDTSVATPATLTYTQSIIGTAHLPLTDMARPGQAAQGGRRPTAAAAAAGAECGGGGGVSKVQQQRQRA